MEPESDWNRDPNSLSLPGSCRNHESFSDLFPLNSGLCVADQSLLPEILNHRTCKGVQQLHGSYRILAGTNNKSHWLFESSCNFSVKLIWFFHSESRLVWIRFLSCMSVSWSISISVFFFTAANQRSCLSWVRSVTSHCSLHQSRRRKRRRRRMTKTTSGHGGHQEEIWPRDTTGRLWTGRYDRSNQSGYRLLITQIHSLILIGCLFLVQQTESVQSDVVVLDSLWQSSEEIWTQN